MGEEFGIFVVVDNLYVSLRERGFGLKIALINWSSISSIEPFLFANYAPLLIPIQRHKPGTLPR